MPPNHDSSVAFGAAVAAFGVDAVCGGRRALLARVALAKGCEVFFKEDAEL